MVDSIAMMTKRQGYSKLAALGIRWTMLETLNTAQLEARSIRTVVLDEVTCLEVEQIIQDELTQGIFTDSSRTRYVEIMNDVKARGADAVALSCTPIALLVPPESAPPSAVDVVDANFAAIVERLMVEEPALSRT